MASANADARAGYGLLAAVNNSDMKNYWAAQVGTGSGFQQVQAADPIVLSQTNNTTNTTFLAMTFDAAMQQLTLYVGPVDMPLIQIPPLSLSSLMPAVSFLAEDGKPPMDTSTPLAIGSGVPGGMLPFDGFIQDVAYYNSALSFDTLKQHFKAGTNAGG